jgi:tetratricopeptide (TPR) repeat protein
MQKMDNSAKLAEKGAALQRSGEYDQVIAYYDKAISNHESSSEYWSGKGMTLFLMAGQDTILLELSKGCYERVLKLNSRSDTAWAGKSVVLQKLKFYE